MISEEEIVENLTMNRHLIHFDSRIDPGHRVNIYTNSESLLEIANFLKHELGFIYPNMCTGTDDKENIEVIWHIGYSEGPVLVVLRIKTSRDESKTYSLTNIWEGFNWHERETYDMLGVNFEGHPDLRRIIMPENWEGHPLRADYIYKKPKYRKLEDE